MSFAVTAFMVRAGTTASTVLAFVGLSVLLVAGFWLLSPGQAPRPRETVATSQAAQPLSSQRRATSQPTSTWPFVTQAADGSLRWPRPRFDQRQRERDRMVASRIAGADSYRSGVTDKRVLTALRTVPRHEFVPPARRGRAYADTPLPIGHGQTISQPYIVALMTQLLEVKEGDVVLEIGMGSGYQAAVLAELTPYVCTIEIVEPLCQEAIERLKQLGYQTVRTRCGDGYQGWAEHAPFDGIIVACAAERVPQPLWRQLKVGGRMVIPVGGVHDIQQLLVLTKRADGSRRTRNVLPVRFVPMTGTVQKP